MAQLAGAAQIFLVAEVVLAVVEVMVLVVIAMASVRNDNAWLLHSTSVALLSSFVWFL